MAKGRLIVATLGALLVAALIVLGAILPAEFDRDPLGIGKLTGLDRLGNGDTESFSGAGTKNLAQEYPAGARSDTIEIPLGMVGGGMGPYSLEYKVRMKKDSVLIYDWQATGLSRPSDLSYDFHGHTTPTDPTEKMVVATHRQARGASSHGSLVAPFDGIQGWYFDNSSDGPVTIRIKLTGFYDLVPSGEAGNEEGIIANLPADQVRARIAAGK
jgi:hypothetical protein